MSRSYETQRVRPPMVTKDAQAIEEYHVYLSKIGYPANLLEIERAWAAQQLPGTVRHVLECVKKIEEWRDKE